jgi:hypothetical protein
MLSASCVTHANPDFFSSNETKVTGGQILHDLKNKPWSGGEDQEIKVTPFSRK